MAVLDRDDAAGDEALAVADAVDLVDDRHSRIAGPQEIGVQRMRLAIRLDGAGRRDERLAEHLAAENALPTIFRAATAEEVVLERLQVEDAEQVFDGGLPCPSSPGIGRRPSGAERRERRLRKSSAKEFAMTHGEPNRTS